MKKYVLAMCLFVMGLVVPAPAYASSSSVTDTFFLGNAASCIAVLPVFACQAQASNAFGQGATGWAGHTSVLGGSFVEPASFGFVFNGSEFNVYNPESDSFTGSLEWLLPSGVNVDNYALGVSAFNAGWVPGRGIVAPN